MNVDRDKYLKGSRYLLCDLIHEHDLLASPLIVLDVGARDAFTATPWTALPTSMVSLHGFEPDSAECERLNERARVENYNFHYHPVALASRTGPIDFYVYANAAASSIFPVNESLTSRWCYGREETFAKGFQLKEKIVLEAMTMQEWATKNKIKDIDFFKMNIQGAELDVLQGAGPLLSTPIGLVMEQCFSQTYIGAPLFGKVYDFVIERGFTFFDSIGPNFVARIRSPIHLGDDKIFGRGNWPRHQFFEGHFLYLRDPILAGENWSKSNLPIEKCIKLACVAEIFGQVEFAFELLVWLASSEAAERIAPACRSVVDRGAELYRQLSIPATPAEAPKPTTRLRRWLSRSRE